MAIGLKFSLKIGNVSIRNIDDLRNNFDIKEVLELFKTGKLYNWLLNRQYHNYAEDINNLHGQPDDLIITELKRILEVTDVTQDQIDAYFASADSASQSQAQPTQEEVKEQVQREINIIDNYYANYLKHIDKIIDDSRSIERLTDDVSELLYKYKTFLNLDFDIFISTIVKQAPLAMLVLMCHKEWWSLCDFFDNNDVRWCSSLDSERVVFKVDEPPITSQGQINDLISSRSAEIVTRNESSSKGFFWDMFVGDKPKENRAISKREAVKDAILKSIEDCKKEWGRYIIELDVWNKDEWTRVVDKGNTCLIVNYRSEFLDLRATGASAIRDGVAVKGVFALSDGFEFKSRKYQTIRYFVLDSWTM